MIETTAQVHASAVAINGKGCLITGDTGSGKSTLCFELMVLGAELIADDRVDLTRVDDSVLLSCPAPLKGRIEARGVGVIETVCTGQPTLCSLSVDLDRTAERLPDLKYRDLLGIPCPVIFGAKRAGLAAIICVLMRNATLLDPNEGINL